MVVFENTKYIIKILEKGILENELKSGAEITKQDIEEIKTINIKHSNNGKYLLLINMDVFTVVTAEARRLTASPLFSETTIAKAVLISTIGHELEVRYYMNIDRPITPTKYFNDREEALNWLKTFNN